jgi:hypothetical protein
MDELAKQKEKEKMKEEIDMQKEVEVRTLHDSSVWRCSCGVAQNACYCTNLLLFHCYIGVPKENIHRRHPSYSGDVQCLVAQVYHCSPREASNAPSGSCGQQTHWYLFVFFGFFFDICYGHRPNLRAQAKSFSSLCPFLLLPSLQLRS